MTIKTLIAGTSAALLLTACATAERQYDGMSSAERGAVAGTAVGAGAGAIIAGRGDDAEGALIGAGVGAAAGYLLGNERDKRQQVRAPQGYNQGAAYVDQNNGRTYYVDPATGATYYANGERRS